MNGDLAVSRSERERRYAELGCWRDVLLDEAVLGDPVARGDRVAVVTRERRIGYRELATAVDRAASGFRSLGLRPGDRVAVRLGNTLDMLLAFLGLVRGGMTPVLMPPGLGIREVDHVVRTTRARALVNRDVGSGAESRALVRHMAEDHPDVLVCLAAEGHLARHRTPPEGVLLLDAVLVGGEPAGTRTLASATVRESADVAFYLLSGGSTGLPKAIPRTHRDYVCNLEVSARLTELGPRSTYLAALPTAHNFVLGCPGVLGTLAAGGTVVLGSPSLGRVVRDIEQERVTITALVPGLARLLPEHATDLSSLEVLQVGGARLYEPDARRLISALPGRLQQVFGMAEGLLNFTRLDDPDDVVATTQGRPASSADEWFLADGSGSPLPAGQEGELLVRGPYTIGGYLAPEEVNRSSFTADGFYRTGDIVRLHESGNFVVVGRRKDFVNRGGEKVSASELETVLADCGALAASAVVPVPDDLHGEVVCVAAVPASGTAVDLHTVRDFMLSRGIARYKLPEHLVLCERLPVTAVGKIDRVALAEQAREQVLPAPGVPQDADSTTP
ncbi:AMP-binding protein [Streptomyces sp. BHT-5-2]|uniref:(2,3-dihydroxybenzoyl)adenylate synthase n=1 Tax=Streptomyces sp. BHT-5-2 TaxID=2866715 RepID=UPI001C8D0611|nr:AMP-binding protein [Streptomyces sp. BHT-5-2]QZL06393.1 AMP-binding protein [Streptomyces sp. BHT-5-2]